MASELEGAGSRVTLLRTSALLYLFRALAAIADNEGREVVEAQILQVLGDLIPSNGGFLLLGRNEADFRLQARSRELEDVAAAVIENGIKAENGLLAVPLVVRGVTCGALALNTDQADASDTLAAIATIASAAIESAREIEQLHTEKALWEERSAVTIVGESPALRRVVQMAERVAPQDTTVLILGESGTGKELIARTVHQKSRRSNQPFVAINCAALTETLLESELFGHEKGAFTGAVSQKRGKLEMAEGGTVFLDEVGEMESGLQAKLLRVLQEREFERVGGTRTIPLDVRLIAATNRDLSAETKSGRFREDLYHRLNVVALRTPPLRERRQDIPPLAEFFLKRSSARCCRRVDAIAPAAMLALTEYDWPGNVRELENAIERAVVLGETDMLLAEDLPETLFEAAGAELTGDFQAKVIDAKRDSIVRAWMDSGGDYKKAAVALGLHPNSLLRLVRKLGLRGQLGT